LLRIFEKYLEKLGERRGMLLLAAILVWVSILLAIYVYALGVGVLAAWRLSESAYRAIGEIVADRAYGGDRWAVFMGVLVWLLLILLVFPLRAARRVWSDYRRQQIQAQKALTKVEERLFPVGERSSNVHSAQERLARRALDEIETRVLGAPQPADLTIEERLLKLDD
jgi:type VI protein secretion system component VasK